MLVQRYYSCRDVGGIEPLGFSCKGFYIMANELHFFPCRLLNGSQIADSSNVMLVCLFAFAEHFPGKISKLLAKNEH